MKNEVYLPGFMQGSSQYKAEIAMANQYGKAAIMAARQGPSDSPDPKVRWDAAMKKLSTSKSSQKKTCPKDAFLGLCDVGLVKGVHQGNYTESINNKEYAIRAVELLENKGAQFSSRSALWRAVMNGDEKSENGQMGVVLALWDNDLIVRRVARMSRKSDLPAAGDAPLAKP